MIIQLKEARQSISKILHVFSNADSYSERLESSLIELQDLAQELERSNESIEFDPARIDYLNQRLDVIYTLQQKHHVDSVDDLIKIRRI